MTSLRIASALLLVTAAGCTTTDSDFVRTRGMYIDMEAIGGADGTTQVSAILYVTRPGLNFIELRGGDRLVARHGADSKGMTEFEFLGTIRYRASFPSNAADAEFVVDFQRDADPGAPSTVATLPPPFTATVPQSHSRAQSLVVSWSPVSTEPMRWTLTGNCIDRVEETLAPDPGSLEIPAGVIVKRADEDGQPPVPDTCQVTFTLSRDRAGIADPAFNNDEEGGGGVVGRQVRSATLTSAP